MNSHLDKSFNLINLLNINKSFYIIVYYAEKKSNIIKIMFFFIIIFIILKKPNKKKIGVVGLKNHNNIGNNLVKFSMYIKLKEFGFEPTIIGFSSKYQNYDFLKKHVKLKEVSKTFSELKENDYNILMVNSDQTWNGNKNNTTLLLNYGYLKFAENWTIPRFVYGASLGVNHWKFSKNFDIMARRLITKFSDFSVRERDSIKLVKKHLGVNPQFVLDPTFIIDKKYYLDLIKDFKVNFHSKEKYLCIYQLDKNKKIEKLIKKVSKKYNYTIYKINRFKDNYIENFIFYINISNAVITDSYHGTIFSIIFKKPFISFINTRRGKG